jgi:DNA-binding response OmpR family regulator
MRIALLDDDKDQSPQICEALARIGHECATFEDGPQLLAYLRTEPCDMLIVNWRVTDASGAAAIGWVREKLPHALPILLVVGRADESVIPAALAGGASDYIVKPVRRGELVLRVRVLLRSAYPALSEVRQIRFGEHVFDMSAVRLWVGGAPVEVTQKEFNLALLFFQNLGRPLSRAYILEKIWSQEADVPSRTVDTHVSRVRNKLCLKPGHGFRLTPVYSYGYRLEQLSK